MSKRIGIDHSLENGASNPPFEALQSHFEFLEHLIRFSQLSLLIVSNRPEELSHFRRLFLENLPDDLEQRTLRASQISHPAELLDELALLYDIEIPKTLDLEESIANLHQGFLDLNKTPVLIVDEVNQLSSKLLSTLLRFLTTKSVEVSSLKCILFGSSALLRTLESEALSAYGKGHIHVCQLENLGDQVLIDPVSSEALTEDSTLEEEAQEMAHPRVRDQDLSGQAATWQDGTLFSKLVKKLDNNVPLHWWVAGGAIAVLLLSVVGQLLFGHSSTPLPSKEVVDPSAFVIANKKNDIIPSETQANRGEDLQSTQSTLPEKAEPVLESMPSARPISHSEIVTEEPLTTQVLEPKVLQKAPQPVPQTVPQTVAPVVAKQPVVAKRLAKEALDVSLTAKKDEPLTSTLVRRSRERHLNQPPLTQMEQIVLSWNPNHFTLQLMASSNEKAVKSFQAKVNVKTYLLKTKQNGQNWTVLVTGDYASRREASNAVRELPNALRRLQPWPKQVATLQTGVKAMHASY